MFLRTISAIVASALLLAVTTASNNVKVTHSELDIHIDTEMTAKWVSIVDEFNNSIELMSNYEEHQRFTAEEKEILCRIAEAEATDGTIQQKKNVMSCVMNRVISDQFPNTIKSVVFQSGQFSPISDGRYYSVTIQESTYQAYDEWLADCDEGNVHDCLFFCMPTCKSAVSGWFSTKHIEFNDGMHNYYR